MAQTELKNARTSLAKAKKETTKIAKKLGYGKKIIAQILNAETETQIDRILIAARCSMK